MSITIFIILALLILFLIGVWLVVQKSKTVAYPGASLVFEGGGIRRGLNPVEVARLLALSEDQIVSLALAGLFEKGFVLLDEADKILPAEWLQAEEFLDAASRTAFRIRQAYQHDQILMPYEDVLLELLIQTKGAPLDQSRRALWFSFLDKTLNQKMAGYHLQATHDYYYEFISHRIKEIWNTPEEIKSNILWVLCASFDEKLNTQKVQEALSGYSPDWLPALLQLNKFIQQV